MEKENRDAMDKMTDLKDSLFYRELNAKLIRENRKLKQSESVNIIDILYIHMIYIILIIF